MMKKSLLTVIMFLAIVSAAAAYCLPESAVKTPFRHLTASDPKALYEQFIEKQKSEDYDENCESEEYLEKSAMLDYLPAQELMGTLKLHGHTEIDSVYLSLDSDFEKALLYNTKAADRGSATALYNLGYTYELGWGVEENIQTAVMYYQKAADKGHPDALYEMGRNYLFGNYDLPTDGKKAVKLLDKAAKQGSQDAINLLGEIYTYGSEEVAQIMFDINATTDKNKIQPNVDKAIAYYTMESAKDNYNAILKLALIYKDDSLGRVDYAKSLALLKKLFTEDLDNRASYHLGEMYEKGMGVEKNIHLARALFKTSLSESYCTCALQSALRFAKAYLNGEDLVFGEKDLDKAFSLLDLAYNNFFEYAGFSFLNYTLAEKTELLDLLIQYYENGGTKELYAVQAADIDKNSYQVVKEGRENLFQPLVKEPREGLEFNTEE